MGFETDCGSLNKILVEKSGSLALPITYSGLAQQPVSYQSRSPLVMASFQRTGKPPLTSKAFPIVLDYLTISGSSELFYRLYRCGAFSSRDSMYLRYAPLSLAFNTHTPELQHFSPATFDKIQFKTADARKMFVYENRFFSPYLQHKHDEQFGIVPYTNDRFKP